MLDFLYIGNWGTERNSVTLQNGGRASTAEMEGEIINVKYEHYCTTLGPIGVASLKIGIVYLYSQWYGIVTSLCFGKIKVIFLVGGPQLSPSWFKWLYNMAEV